ncbi:MAG: MFS transporter, partial [Peptococcaceae bacterium]|jgi:MFS family permease|nr:MFS transporter [Peptococcaceae bacterium]
LGHAPVYYTVSTVLYGLSALSVPAIMAAVCGDLFGPRLAATGLGCVTVFMGVGQVLGPVLSGVLADAMGTFSPVYMLTAALTLVAAGIVIWRFRDQGTH